MLSGAGSTGVSFRPSVRRSSARALAVCALLAGFVAASGCQAADLDDADEGVRPTREQLPAVVAHTVVEPAPASEDEQDDFGSESPPELAQHSEAERCPEGMQLVEGEHCPWLGHRCVEWINEKQDRCKRYAPPPLCHGRTKRVSVCMDRYEYPNQPGVFPAIMVNYVEAAAACAAENKRLCTDIEWTLACEGNERLPYPYGYERDATACNIDRPYGFPDMTAFSDERRVAAEVARLDQRVPSGSMDRCVSPFGVHDMTGNVDEWVFNESRTPDSEVDISGLKGGYFGPIRARCRPMTTAHNRWFRFYQVGFRCCADPAPAGGGAEAAN